MFEHSLIDLETKPRRGRRWLSLPIAVALHVVGLTAFAFASYWSVGEVQEPKTNVVFLTFAPLPELNGGGGGQRPTVKPPVTDEVKPRTPDKPVQPTEETIPDTVPTPTKNETTENESSESWTGIPNNGDALTCPPFCGNGSGDGPPGDGHGEKPGIGDGEGDSQPIRITVGMTRPEIVHQVQPKYTEIARRSGTQGTVIVEAIIDEQGRVTNVRVLRGLPMGLDQAAVNAIQQWRFKPATLASKPVKVYYTLTVNFTIQR